MLCSFVGIILIIFKLCKLVEKKFCNFFQTIFQKKRMKPSQFKNNKKGQVERYLSWAGYFHSIFSSWVNLPIQGTGHLFDGSLDRIKVESIHIKILTENVSSFF